MCDSLNLWLLLIQVEEPDRTAAFLQAETSTTMEMELRFGVQVVWTMDKIKSEPERRPVETVATRYKSRRQK